MGRSPRISMIYWGEANPICYIRRGAFRRNDSAKEGPFVHVGVELGQEEDFSATLTQDYSTKNLELLPAPPALWAGRMNPLSMDDAKLRQCKLGELCCVAAVSRPDICALLSRIASGISAIVGPDVYRIDELV